jgi:hypothetical protein
MLLPQFVKPGLYMDADGVLDPLLNIPPHLHQDWRTATAETAVWATGLDVKEPYTVRAAAGLLAQPTCRLLQLC